MTGIQAGKKDLKVYLGHAGTDIVKEMRETDQKRIMGALVHRLSDGLDVLDCVQARARMPGEAAAEEGKGRIHAVLTSPAVTLLFSAGTIMFAFLAWRAVRRIPAGQVSPAPEFGMHWLFLLLSALLLLGQAVFLLAVKVKGKPSENTHPEAQVLLDVERARVQMEKQLSGLIIDTEAVCGMFHDQRLESANAYEDELVKLFTSLYEAKVDRPECDEFNYSLTMAEMMLRQIGLKTVSYSEEHRSFFNVEAEDHPDQMRFPAVVRALSGEVVRKGEYIRKFTLSK